MGVHRRLRTDYESSRDRDNVDTGRPRTLPLPLKGWDDRQVPPRLACLRALPEEVQWRWEVGPEGFVKE